VTTAEIPGAAARVTTERKQRTIGTVAMRYLTTTDHKVIGNMYFVTSFGFFLLGGVLALIIRAELARSGNQFVADETYNQLFTMHGTIMLLLFATPLFAGFANAIMPLQIGAPDVAFPRRRSVGSPTSRCRTQSTPRGSAVTCGSWVCTSRVWARSSVRSTSSPRSSACGHRA
jgi:hypothetical protein